MTNTNIYDVIVVGGGSGGVAAAVAAARAGARTALIDSNGCLGGAATMRGVFTYCGIYTLDDRVRQAIFGVGGELMERLRMRGALSMPMRHRGVFVAFDPEAVKVELDALCTEAGVDLYFHSFVTGARREGDRIVSIAYANHGGTHELRAHAFVDASGEADLAALGGASTRYGNGGDVNLGSLGTRFGGIPKNVPITARRFQEAIEAAAAGGSGPFTKTTSVMVRLPLSNDLCCYLASADYDPRDASSLAAAEISGRVQAQAYLQALRTIPGCEGAFLALSGPGFGTRESRHISGMRSVRWDDVATGAPTGECIAIGTWGVEWHERSTFVSSMAPPKSAGYEIPLGALISVDTPNLFAAGRTIDGDRKAGASMRVMGTALATGQAAGVAAAIFAEKERSLYPDVEMLLREQGALIDLSALEAQPAVRCLNF